MIDYFDISYSIKNNNPIFKIKLKKKFTEGKDYPKKQISDSKKIPISSSSIEYFNFYFENSLSKELFSFRKQFFNIKIFLEYLNIPESDLNIINKYFLNLKNKEKQNHSSVIQTEEYRTKLRESARKNKDHRKAKLIEKYKNKEERSKLIKNLHSEESKKKRILSFKKTMSNDLVKNKFLEKIRSKEISEKRSASHKRRWASLSREQKQAQIHNLRYKKKYELNGKKMNLNEYIVGSILNDLAIDWKYEPEIIYGNNSFYPDFLIKNNIIIECYGTYWHADPRKFHKDDIFFEKYKAQDIWDMDSNRIGKLKKLGYNVYILWEEDIHSNSEKTKEEIRRIYE